MSLGKVKNIVTTLALLTASHSYGQNISGFRKVPDVNPTFSARCENATSNAVLSFVGDILIHDDIYHNNVNVLKNKTFTPIWAKTNGLIAKADYSVGNLEGPTAMGIDKFGKNHGDTGFDFYGFQRDRKDGMGRIIVPKNPKEDVVYSGTGFEFNYHPRIFQDLKDSGYDLLTTANNHALDRRSLGVDLTLEAAAQYGMPVVGTKHSARPQDQFYTVAQIKGINVAFIACTESLNGKPDPKKQVLICDQSKVPNMISVLIQHPQIDAVIVLPHWGAENVEFPEQKKYLNSVAYLEAGALAVVGNHPHVPQPWEKHVTRDGRETLMIHSLGNFVAWQSPLPNKSSAVAYISLSKNQEDKAVISGVGFTPVHRQSFTIYTWDDSNKPMPRAQQDIIRRNFGTTNEIGTQESLKRFCK